MKIEHYQFQEKLKKKTIIGNKEKKYNKGSGITHTHTYMHTYVSYLKNKTK